MAGLLFVLDDHANPRVQAHAGAALVNFSENCSKPIILPYLGAIMNKLQEILNMKFDEVCVYREVAWGGIHFFFSFPLKYQFRIIKKSMLCLNLL